MGDPGASESTLQRVSLATWELRIPQKDGGIKFLFVAVKRHPIWHLQVAQYAIVHAYLQKKVNDYSISNNHN